MARKNQAGACCCGATCRLVLLDEDTDWTLDSGLLQVGLGGEMQLTGTMSPNSNAGDESYMIISGDPATASNVVSGSFTFTIDGNAYTIQLGVSSSIAVPGRTVTWDDSESLGHLSSPMRSFAIRVTPTHVWIILANQYSNFSIVDSTKVDWDPRYYIMAVHERTATPDPDFSVSSAGGTFGEIYITSTRVSGDGALECFVPPSPINNMTLFELNRGANGSFTSAMLPDAGWTATRPVHGTHWDDFWEFTDAFGNYSNVSLTENSIYNGPGGFGFPLDGTPPLSPGNIWDGGTTLGIDFTGQLDPLFDSLDGYGLWYDITSGAFANGVPQPGFSGPQNLANANLTSGNIAQTFAVDFGTPTTGTPYPIPTYEWTIAVVGPQFTLPREINETPTMEYNYTGLAATDSVHSIPINDLGSVAQSQSIDPPFSVGSEPGTLTFTYWNSQMTAFWNLGTV